MAEGSDAARDWTEWEVVESSDAQKQWLKAREAHHQRCEQERLQAAEAHRALINAQRDAQLGQLRADEVCLDDVHRVCCVPGTAVPIAKLQWENPLTIRTRAVHHFQDGQSVIITGVRLKVGAPHSAACFVRDLSQDHVVRGEDECRILLPGMGKSYDEEEVTPFIDLEQAEVWLCISSWAVGRTPITHSALRALAQTAKASGLSHAIQTALSTVRTACSGVQLCAEALAGHLEHRQRLADGGSEAGSDTLGHISSALKTVSGASVPALESRAKDQWDILAEAVQPEHWVPARSCHACQECFAPLRVALPTQPEPVGQEGRVSSAHHCRHCGRVVCHTCAVDRECVPWRGEFQPGLICKPCKPVVILRNLCVQHLRSLNVQIEMVAAGLCPPERKGRGKGAPPGPPPPAPKGKGRGRGLPQEKAGKELMRGPGLGALGDDIQPQLSELADFVVLPAGVPQARSSPGPRPPKEITILDERESFKWHVASNCYRPHLEDILRCLKSIELKEPRDEDSWFDALEQVFPLEEKLSEGTLKRLKAVPAQEQQKLREYEQHICLLLTVPNLQLRWSSLKLLRDLHFEQGNFLAKCGAVQAAFAAAVLCSEEGTWALRSEVKNVVALLYKAIEPKCEKLQDLVSRSEFGNGKLQLTKLSKAGETHKDFDTRGFVKILAPVLEGSGVGAMKDTLQRLMDLRKRFSLLKADCGAEDPGMTKALEKMDLIFTRMEDCMVLCFDEGRRFLVLLKQWHEDLPAKGLSESAVLAQAIDENLQSLKTLTRRLQDVQPALPDSERARGIRSKVAKPAAKARGTRSLPTRAPKTAKRRAAPDARKVSADTHLVPSSGLPDELPGALKAYNYDEKEPYCLTSSDETCDGDDISAAVLAKPTAELRQTCTDSSGPIFAVPDGFEALTS